MTIAIKTYEKLSKDELYEILKLRINTFIIEQKSLYEDLDDLEKEALHFFIKEDEKIIAYLRLLEKSQNPKIIKLTRVISKKKGLGKKIMQSAIEKSFKDLDAEKIFIEAQVSAKIFYEKLGFKQTSKPYELDGISHIDMILEK